MTTMRHIVMFSGGVGSFLAAARTVDFYGPDAVTLLFADTRIEDDDLYRFVDDAADHLGAKLVTIADGRTPWQLFADVRMIGNTRADICSRVLKRDLMRRWIDDHADPDDTTIVLGIDWTEHHRFDRVRHRWKPWTVTAPMCDPPLLDKPEMIAEVRRRGIEPPRLYQLGFPHNNCGGFCVKAGIGQFLLLLEKLPDRYRAHEAEEERVRRIIGKDVAVLRDRRGGTTRPLTLAELRRRVEAGGEQLTLDGIDEFGGCGCAIE